MRFGQLGQAGLLTIKVSLNGQPVPDASLEVLFADGSTENGKTGKDGLLAVPYDPKQGATATVRLLTMPAGAKDIGEDANKGIALPASGPTSVEFILESDHSAAASQGSKTPAIVLLVLLVALIGGNYLLKRY